MRLRVMFLIPVAVVFVLSLIIVSIVSARLTADAAEVGALAIIARVVPIGIAAIVVVILVLLYLVNFVIRKIDWYENILDTLPLLLSVTDMKMNWTFVNKPVEAFLGKKRQEVVGKHCSSWGAAICGTHNCGVKCVERGQNSTTFDQMGMDFKVDVAYLVDRKNKKVGHIEIVQDITEMVKKQKAEGEIVRDIENISRQFITASNQIAGGAQSLAQGATEQAATVEQLSASIAEIAEKTEENANLAEQAAKLAGTIMQNAEKGSTQMEEMTIAVGAINQASQQISKVIKVIDDIAFQTNILALNAAVEAARAGQHGKGFAVVAEEVRNLAAKSAEAAKDTGELIANSIEKAEQGERITQETAASLGEIVTGIDQSNKLISDIAQASKSQSIGLGQINHGIEQVTQVVQQTSATAQESAAAAYELKDQSDALEGLIDRFQLTENSDANKELPPVD